MPHDKHHTPRRLSSAMDGIDPGCEFEPGSAAMTLSVCPSPEPALSRTVGTRRCLLLGVSFTWSIFRSGWIIGVPQYANQSSEEIFSIAFATAYHRRSTVLSSAARIRALSFENAIPIGLRSGGYGGRYGRWAAAALIAVRAPETLWAGSYA